MITWRKSSYSDTQGNDCVEVAALPHGIGIRDSKNADAGHQSLSHQTFAALVKTIKNNELDL